MSCSDLRSKAIRLAASYPEGSDERRVLMAAIMGNKEKGVIMHICDLNGSQNLHAIVQAIESRNKKEFDYLIKNFDRKERETLNGIFDESADIGRSASTARVAAHPLDRARKHTLMPGNIRSKIPDIGSQDGSDDPIAYVKFFCPYSQAVWYITEFDGRDEMFGWADLGMGGGELGYISLDELESADRNGLPLVERDLYWSPRPLSQAKRS